jgi:hypothetical protein
MALEGALLGRADLRGKNILLLLVLLVATGATSAFGSATERINPATSPAFECALWNGGGNVVQSGGSVARENHNLTRSGESKPRVERLNW